MDQLILIGIAAADTVFAFNLKATFKAFVFHFFKFIIQCCINDASDCIPVDCKNVVVYFGIDEVAFKNLFMVFPVYFAI